MDLKQIRANYIWVSPNRNIVYGPNTNYPSDTRIALCIPRIAQLLE